MAEGDEEQLLKSVALRNSQTILIARQKAERALSQAKDELARMVEELVDEREWLRIVLASIGDAVITIDIKGNVTFLNPEAELLTGWSSSEALGQPLESIFKVVSGKTREAMPSRVADVLRKGAHVAPPRTTVLIARNGVESTIEDATTPVRNNAGKVIGAVMVFRDSAERTDEN